MSWSPCECEKYKDLLEKNKDLLKKWFIGAKTERARDPKGEAWRKKVNAITEAKKKLWRRARIKCNIPGSGGGRRTRRRRKQRGGSCKNSWRWQGKCSSPNCCKGGRRRSRRKKKKRRRSGGGNNNNLSEKDALQIEDEGVGYHDFSKENAREMRLYGPLVSPLGAPRWNPGKLPSHTPILSKLQKRRTIKEKKRKTLTRKDKKKLKKLAAAKKLFRWSSNSAAARPVSTSSGITRSWASEETQNNVAAAAPRVKRGPPPAPARFLRRLWKKKVGKLGVIYDLKTPEGKAAAAATAKRTMRQVAEMAEAAEAAELAKWDAMVKRQQAAGQGGGARRRKKKRQRRKTRRRQRGGLKKAEFRYDAKAFISKAQNINPGQKPPKPWW